MAFRATNSFATVEQLNYASNHIDASKVVGVIPAANLGTGTANSTTFLRGDGQYATPAGSGNFTGPGSAVSGNFLSFNGTSGTLGQDSGFNSGSFALPSTTLTIAGTANQITSSAGAQDLSANRTWTLSFPNILILPGTLNVTGAQSNQSTLSIFGVQTNFSDLYIRGNGFMGGNLLVTSNQLIDGSALKASQYVSTDGSTNFVSTQNGINFTNTWHFTNFLAQTNIILITNGPDVFITVAGNAIGPWSLRIKTNITLHLPPQVWFVGYSNNLATNCLLDFQPFGGTNEVVGALSER